MKNRSTILVAILPVLACFALLSGARAVSPTPDGCYPNFTTAEGCDALNFLTTGAGNTALGWRSLFLDTTGSFNTGVGGGALALNNGDSNTAVGTGALLLNSTGFNNTAVGTDALVFNDTGQGNTALGAFALFNSIDGVGNVAVGRDALHDSTGGDENTAVGVGALGAITTGSFNTAIGGIAGFGLTTGQFNTIIGDIAGGLITTASNVICIGHGGKNISNACLIGHIRGVTTDLNDAIPVVIDSAGQLGTVSSSVRFKKDVKPMDKASEDLFALKPVTFHYKTDRANRPEYGLIAEEVAKVNPNLVVRNEDGQIYTVRYEAVNAMLLNEFLKENKKVQDLEAKVAQQQKGMEVLTAQLKEQAAQIQKVSAQLEMSKPAAKMVVNEP
jgi:Chaperone of endosialidase